MKKKLSVFFIIYLTLQNIIERYIGVFSNFIAISSDNWKKKDFKKSSIIDFIFNLLKMNFFLNFRALKITKVRFSNGSSNKLLIPFNEKD